MTSLLPNRYAVDLTGISPDNAVVGEPHTLARRKVRIIAPMHAPYFKKSLVITDTVSNKVLTSAQYRCLNLVALPSALAGIGNEVYAIIAITDTAVSDTVVIKYQTVGGHYTRSYTTTQALIETLTSDTRPASWENLLGIDDAFEPSLHLHAVGDAIGWEYVAVALEGLRSTLLLGDAVGHDEILRYIDTQLAPIKALLDELETGDAFTAHTASRVNPHQVTKTQVGLGSVQNYPLASDAEALAGVATNRYMTTALVSKLISGIGGGDLSAHAADKTNPHDVTKAQVGLSNVQNYPMATNAEALAGTATNRYLSPASLKAALAPFEASTLRVAVNESLALGAGGFKEYDLQALLGSDYAQYNLSSPSVIFRIKDTAAGATNAMYINAWPLAVAAVYGNRYVRLHSKHASALDCRVLISVGKGAGFLTPLVPSYTLTPSVTAVNEGSAVTFTLQTTNVPNGTELYWSTGGVGISAGDFTDGQMTGSVTILNNSASIVRTLKADALTEGAEAFVISLRVGSVTGTVVEGASSVNVADTSRTGSTYTVTSSVTNVDEFAPNNKVVFTVVTTDVLDDEVLYYTAKGTGIGATDFSSNIASGQFTVANNKGVVTLTIAADGVQEWDETFVFAVHTGSIAGPVVGNTVSVLINEQLPVFNLTTGTLTVAEGASKVFSVSAPDSADGDKIYYSIVGAGVSEADFTDGVLSGQLTIMNNAASFTKTLSSDLTTEGAESFSVMLRTGSATGPIVSQVLTLSIQDTSLTPPTYAINPVDTTVNEGGTLTWNFVTARVDNGTPLYWKLTGTAGDSDLSGTGLTGTIVIQNNAATLSLSAINDVTTEGAETVILTLRTGSQEGTVVKTSAAITIADTSRYPASGTLIQYYCSGTTRMAQYANGTGGTYSATIAANSTECGYVAPVYPANGTKLSEACSGTTLVGTYANGTGGTYSATIAANSTACGYVAPPVYPANGTYLRYYCSGTTKMGVYANGSGGEYNAAIASNSPDCGYVAPVYPAYGIKLSQACSGTTLVGTYANGSGGTYTANIEVNSVTCGYVAPPVYPAAGTVLSTWCGTSAENGTATYNYSVANGAGGSTTYSQSAENTICDTEGGTA